MTHREVHPAYDADREIMMMKRVAISVMSTLLLACSGALGVDGVVGGTTVRAVGDSLSIAVAVAPAELQAGDTAKVTVTLTNRRARDVVVDFSNGCQLMFAVERGDGTPVGPQFYCTDVLTSLRLAPHATETRTLDWDSATYTYSPYARTPLPAGSYRIYGELEIAGKPRSGPILVSVLKP